jgi:hypothetical protein
LRNCNLKFKLRLSGSSAMRLKQRRIAGWARGLKQSSFEEVAHAQSLQEWGLGPKRGEKEERRNEGTHKSKHRAASGQQKEKAP